MYEKVGETSNRTFPRFANGRNGKNSDNGLQPRTTFCRERERCISFNGNRYAVVTGACARIFLFCLTAADVSAGSGRIGTAYGEDHEIRTRARYRPRSENT